MKLDKKDLQILFEMEYNARIPLTSLAKKVGLSPQTTKHRIKRLEKKGIIKRYIPLINVAKFGYLYYRIYIRYENTSLTKEKEILNSLQNNPNIAWIVSLDGRWDLEVLFIARNFIHLNELLKELYKKFPGNLQNNIISVSVENYHQRRGYLLNKTTEFQKTYGQEPEKIKIDETDKKILKILNQNARQTNSEIGQRLNLNYKTIQQRIKKMEEKEIILSYRTWLDFHKLNVIYKKSLIKLKNFDEKEKEKILEFCKSKPNITYLITAVWPWNIEIEMEAESENKILELIKEFRELESKNILDYESLTVTDEHKLNYAPFF